jgi:hypothetical protein
LDWTMERFQDALLTAELDPGLFRRQGELAEKKEARIQQFLSVLQRAIGAAPAAASRAEVIKEIAVKESSNARRPQKHVAKVTIRTNRA